MSLAAKLVTRPLGCVRRMSLDIGGIGGFASPMSKAKRAKIKILIADDEPQITDALARQAKAFGLEPITDNSSENVFKLAKKHRPAVIILDVMQRIDGRDLLTQLKKDPETKDIKVIMLSAIEDQYTRHVCFSLGADDYAVKPIDVTFMAKVARMAGVRNPEATSQSS
jgi:DNA-binding response OmpR family regulator